MEENNTEGLDSTADKIEDTAKDAANELKEGWNKVTENKENKKIITGILAIVFGYLGIHKFVLGYTQEGVILLVLGLLGIFTCGITSIISGIIGLIEGVIYLTKNDEEFYNTYQASKKPWF
ncbi:MAG: TM2 domain-containing membrane protein YozV [Candidatus Latescibacterota bacterium]|jgi:TM2 domain-containing membrane protein YozV